MIPKVIHYCWFGHNPLPKEVKKCIESWRKYCPDYEIVEWNESNFDVHCHPFVESAYKAKAWAFVSDYARLKIIYENGGIYMDTDVELLKNIDFLLDHKMYVGIQQVEMLCNTGLGFGAEPHHPIVKEMLAKYNDLIYSDEISQSIACPYLNDAVIRAHGYKNSTEVVTIDNLTVYPPEYMDPISPGDANNLLSDNSFSISHYFASWTSGSNKLKRRVVNLIGQERVNKIKKILGRK